MYFNYYCNGSLCPYNSVDTLRLYNEINYVYTYLTLDGKRN